MQVRKTILICYWVVFMCSAVITIAQPNFVTNLSKIKVGEQEYLQAEYVVENVNTLHSFQAPVFNGFKVIAFNKPFGKLINNGKLNRYFAFIYTLEPVKAGLFNIDPAIAKADGQLLSSKPLKIQVLNGPAPAKMPVGLMVISLKQTGGELINDINDFVVSAAEDTNVKINKQVYVKAEANRKEVFVGEPLLTTYKFYTHLSSKANIMKRPSFNGFSVYEMPDYGWNIPQPETLNRRKYNVYTIRKAQLFPLQPGEAELEGMEIQCQTSLMRSEALKNSDRINSNALIDQYFKNTIGSDILFSHTTLIKTEPLKIMVKELPEKGKPEKFSGAVGNFSITSALSTDKFESGEAVTLTLTIRGSGNMPLINAPMIAWPAGIEAFEPKIREQYDPVSFPLSGEKSFEYSFVPLKEGRTQIPAVEFNFFDPATQEYKQISTKRFLLDVKKGTNQYKARQSEDDTRSNSKKFYDMIGGPWLLLLLLIIPVYFIVKWNRRQKKKDVLAQKKMPDAINKDEIIKESVVEPVITDPLQNSRFVLNESGKTFYGVLQNELWAFFEKRFGMTVASRNKQLLKQHLKATKLQPYDVEQIIGIIMLCESAVYSPVDPHGDHEGVLKEAEQIIRQLS